MRTRRYVDEVDARIIRLLQGDGRIANTAIARKLGIAEATVRNRIERLLRDGVMQVGAWADPLKIGYQTYAMIELQVKPDYIERVAERLAALPEVYFVGVCTGGFDIYAGAVFRSAEHMYELMTRRLARIPGIIHSSTASILRLVKRDYSYPIPAAENGAAGPADGAAPAGRPARPRSRRAPRGRTT